VWWYLVLVSGCGKQYGLLALSVGMCVLCERNLYDGRGAGYTYACSFSREINEDQRGLERTMSKDSPRGDGQCERWSFQDRHLRPENSHTALASSHRMSA
jgi:hypothetical protein